MSPISREEITFRKAVWGTDIYTDDSDVIAACIHQGWFRGQWPDDVDISMLGLDLDAPSSAPAVAPSKVDLDGFLSTPPSNGPAEVPSNQDLHVKIVILPRLEKYVGCIRFGLKSRDWGKPHAKSRTVVLGPDDTTPHDGMSFMILGIKWVTGLDSGIPEKGAAGRHKLMARELDAKEMEAEKAWGGKLFDNGGLLEGRNGREHEQMDGMEESFERGTDEGETAVLMNGGDIRGVGMGSWWKREENEKFVATEALEDATQVLEDEPVSDTLMIDEAMMAGPADEANAPSAPDAPDAPDVPAQVSPEQPERVNDAGDDSNEALVKQDPDGGGEAPQIADANVA